MKKVLFSLIALMAVMTVQAQSIHSSWHIMQPVVDTEADGSFKVQSLTYTFYEDGTYYLIDELTLSSVPSQTMELEVATNIELKGTYTLEGDKLTLKPNMNTYKTELLSISRNGKVTTDRKVAAKVNDMLTSKEFKDKFSKTQEYKVKIGQASMQMIDGRNTVNYVRFATIKN